MTYKRLLLFLLSVLLSTSLHAQDIEQWGRFEKSFIVKPQKKPFTGVTLTAVFSSADSSYSVSGFYDGNDTFRIRFMPQQTGKWQYKTTSNVAELNNRKGEFTCVKATNGHSGIVRVSDTYAFRYANGQHYYPFGTTAYAWTHMGAGTQEITLNSLKKSGFNKLRMCIFPKNYELVSEEPPLFPFAVKEITKNRAGKDSTIWDFDTFNPAFFQHLEKRIDDLNKLGIEADLILFHPYDKGRWGFDAMPNEVNIRYLKYLIARVGSFRNVWWSLANEWDYVKSKTVSDWDILAKTIARNDPYKHLCSIHGATATYYDYWKPEFTHVSIQDETPVQSPNAAALLRHVYHKPIVLDEVGYEGNLKSRWGRYSPEEMTHLVWNGVLGGTYVTHGECYMTNPTDTIFWAKGGEWKGTSWKRIAFLRTIVEAFPNPLCLSDVSRDNFTATAGEGQYLVYFGKDVNESWLFNLPVKNASYRKLTAGTRFKVEVIDTGEMTIQTNPQIFETAKENDYRLYDKDLKKVRLPAKPYMALRITEIKE
ncbi:DUF5060 domain-containing protein [Spirosoma aerophilum]